MKEQTRRADDDAETGLSRSLQTTIHEKTAAITERALRGQEQLDAEVSLTYHVRLVLDNDEALYDARRAIIREHLATREECPFCNGSGFAGEIDGRPDDHSQCEHCNGTGFARRYPHQLGDRLKEWCEELAGLEYADEATDNFRDDLLSGELLSTALAWIDWNQLAADYIEEERETERDD